MTETSPAAAPSTASIVSRVQGILMTPKAEWDKIEPEAATTQGLYMGYAAILAAIPAIAWPHWRRAQRDDPLTACLGICVQPQPGQSLVVGVVGAIVGYVLGPGRRSPSLPGSSSTNWRRASAGRRTAFRP